MRKKLLALAGAALVLTGCASEMPEPEAKPSAETAVTETATQEQVASVIAKHESTFRDANDKSFDCRFSYASNPASIESLTCATEQKTVVLTAQNAARDLRGLTAPDSMQPLLDETLAKLDLVGDVDMSACGEKPDPSDAACSEQLTALDIYLGTLSGTLNAWGPYL